MRISAIALRPPNSVTSPTPLTISTASENWAYIFFAYFSTFLIVKSSFVQIGDIILGLFCTLEIVSVCFRPFVFYGGCGCAEVLSC